MQYIGSDFQTQPLNAAPQDAKVLDVPDLANQSMNSIRQSVADTQRINSTASNADAEAAGRKVVVQQQESGGVLGVVTELAKLGVSYAENQRKQEAAQAERDFIIESEKLSANAPDLINKTSEGGIGYQSQVEKLAAKYGNRVDPALLNKQLLRLYSPVQQYQEKGVDALRKEADKIKDSNTEVFVKQQVLNLDTQLANLEQVKDPQERETKINNILKIFSDSLVNSKLSKPEVLYATNAFLTVIGKSSAKSSEEGAKFLESIRAINETNNFIEQSRGLPDEQRASAQLAKLASLPANLRDVYKQLLDPSEIRKQEIEDIKNAQEMQAAVRRNEMEAGKAFQITSDATLALTANYINSNGVERATFRERFKGIPALEAVVVAADSYLKDQDKKQELAKEQAQLASTIAGIGKGDAKERLGWVYKAFDLPNVTFNADIVTELKQAVERAQKAAAGGVPAEIQKAQQDVEKFNKIVLEATQARAQQVSEMFKNIDTPWVKLEENIRDPQKRQINAQRLTETLQSLDAAKQEYNKSLLRGTNPNFNMPQLAELQVGDVKLPLPFKAGTQVTFTSSYKEVSPLRGNREHAGIDIAVAANTPLIAPISGTVLSASSYSGYGKTIDIRAPDGKILRYAHLNRLDVKEGQQILAGQVIGLTGNTGVGTGDHLHFEVRNDLYGGVEKTEDPIAWSVKNLSNANRGVSARRGANVPNGIPPNAFPLSGAYLQDGKIYRDDGTVGTPSYNNRNPIKNIPLPTDKNAYSSSPDKNYGYQVVAEDKAFRQELNRVASSLKIPTQWLADLMAFETGGTFGTSATNPDTSARGLIQFMPDTAAELGTSTEALAGMSRAQQMKYVEKFLRIHTNNGKLVSKPEDLVMAVWGGIGNLQKLKRDPESVRNISDGNIKFSEYVKRLGEHAGRRYQTSFEPTVTPVHTSFRSSCLSCQALVRSGMGFIPHQAP